MRIKDRYVYDPATDLLGKGGFARVFRARDELLSREVALKVFSKLGSDQYSVLSEIRKAIQLEHPNLLRYYDVLLLKQSNALGEEEELQVGVMEYANAGDLKSWLRANPGTDQLPRLLREVLQGLEYLHGRGIIHRDLKAQNILLVERGGAVTAKISDFGISKDLSGTDPGSSSLLVGTVEYMAPEQFYPAKFGIDGKVQPNADLWAFGVMVHELLTDSTPFGRRDGNTTVEQIMAAIVDAKLPEQIEALAEPYRSVVRKCLVADARQRIRKASELLAAFGEPSGDPAAGGNWSADDTVPLDRDRLGADQTWPFARKPGGAAATPQPAAAAAAAKSGAPGLLRRWIAARPATAFSAMGVLAIGLGIAAWFGLQGGSSEAGERGASVSPQEFVTTSMLAAMATREATCLALCMGQPGARSDEWPGSWSEPRLVGQITHQLPDDGKERAARVARYYCRSDDGGLVTLHQRGECDGLTCTADVFASCFEPQPPSARPAQVKACRALCKQQTNLE